MLCNVIKNAVHDPLKGTYHEKSEKHEKGQPSTLFW